MRGSLRVRQVHPTCGRLDDPGLPVDMGRVEGFCAGTMMYFGGDWNLGRSDAVTSFDATLTDWGVTEAPFCPSLEGAQRAVQIQASAP